MLLALGLLAGLCAPMALQAQNLNDSNTPLHLLAPQYQTPYGMLAVEDVKASMDRILHYLEATTPARVVDAKTGKEVTDFHALTPTSQLERGDFRLASYEWGVTYSAMMAAFKNTGDTLYRHYVAKRFGFLSQWFPYFQQAYYQNGRIDGQIQQFLTPRALDDAGAMCAAMIKWQLQDKSLDLKPMIDNYFTYVMYNQYRLEDGTFARKRPQMNTVWLDDMFMGIPPVAWMGRYASDNNAKFYAEAVRQVQQFADRMFIPEKGLFRHGWVASMSDHPAFCWGRANGWAFLTLCEVLDALPQNHPQRGDVLALFRAHVRGLAACQDASGFWHQLLDRPDSYLETSATAIFVYGMAHAINEGWIDALAYGPVVQLGWHAVSTKINEQGQVEGTCVGTGMAFDPAFYYNRPVNNFAAHGYGPVLWAGAEMIRLLQHTYPRMNDSAVQYYTQPVDAQGPIFSLGQRDITPGSTRQDNQPVVFLIGDSTVKCGGGNGEGGMWGWGSFFAPFFDTQRIAVENHALGGRSSRTFYTEGLWDAVLPALKKGDYLFIQFGHNDGGPLNTGRARASLPGIGEASQTVIMERHGGPETVYTYGHYMRLYVRQAKARGAIVILLSHTPGNRWEGDKIRRCDTTYGLWTQQIAQEEDVFFVDLNALTANKLDALGPVEAAKLFQDGVHNNQEGAVMNGQSVIDGVRLLKDCSLKKYIK